MVLPENERPRSAEGGRGGGIFIADNGLLAHNPETLKIENSIIADNTATTAPDISNHADMAAPDVKFSLIGDNSGSTLAEGLFIDANVNQIGSSGGNIIGTDNSPDAFNGNERNLIAVANNWHIDLQDGDG